MFTRFYSSINKSLSTLAYKQLFSNYSRLHIIFMWLIYALKNDDSGI